MDRSVKFRDGGDVEGDGEADLYVVSTSGCMKKFWEPLWL